jgi:hypothetical protein
MISTVVIYLSYKIEFEKHVDFDGDDVPVIWSIIIGVTFPISFPVLLTLYVTKFLYNKFKNKQK